MPDVSPQAVTQHRPLHTMDTPAACGDAIDDTLALLTPPLIDQELPIVFCDLTTIRTEGQLESAGELRQYGLAKEGDIARLVIPGVVKIAEGLPIHYEVFAGNAAETHTFVPTFRKVLARYPIWRVVLVAERGLLSLDNLEAVQAI